MNTVHNAVFKHFQWLTWSIFSSWKWDLFTYLQRNVGPLFFAKLVCFSHIGWFLRIKNWVGYYLFFNYLEIDWLVYFGLLSPANPSNLNLNLWLGIFLQDILNRKPKLCFHQLQQAWSNKAAPECHYHPYVWMLVWCTFKLPPLLLVYTWVIDSVKTLLLVTGRFLSFSSYYLSHTMLRGHFDGFNKDVKTNCL